jgi:hypothetical protein
VEPRTTEMVRLNMRPTGRCRGQRGRRGPSSGLQRAACTVLRGVLLDKPMRPMSNLRLRRPGGVPCTEFNPHLGKSR